MMKTVIRIGPALAVVLLGLELSLAPARAQTAQIESIEGSSVFVLPSGGTSYVWASEEAELGVGDALLPAPRSRVTVRCPSGNRATVVPGRLSGVRTFCPDVRSTVRYRGDTDLLALNRGDFPYSVQVLEPQPTLRWPAQPGASAYRVQMYGQNPAGELTARIWSEEVSGTVVDYGGPALQAGERYSLVVEAAESDTTVPCGEMADTKPLNRWRQGDCFRVGLGLLEPEDQAALVADVAAIEALGEDGAAQQLALAHRYEAAGLYWQALDTLAVLMAESQPSAVHQLLGEVSLQAGQIAAAEGAYKQARYLAMGERENWTRLDATLGLAKVAAWREQPEVAARYLWQALAVVSTLEDLDQADAIVQWLGKLD